MPDKLSRARHTRKPEPIEDAPRTARSEEGDGAWDPDSTAAIPVVGRHGGVDRTRAAQPAAKRARHAGEDRTREEAPRFQDAPEP